MSVAMRFLPMTMFAFLATTGCGGSDSSGPRSDKSLAEEHPAATDSAWSETAAVWSANGAELAYVLPDRATAVARSAATGVRRVLYVASAPERIDELELSPDGSESFSLTIRAGQSSLAGSTIRRHRAGSTEVLTDRGVVNFFYDSKRRNVAVAANGDFAYIVRPDSLFARRKSGTPAQFIGIGCTGIAAVAPAGDGFICYNTQSTRTVSRYTTSATAPTVITPRLNGFIEQTVWTVQDISFVMATALLSGFAYERYSDPAATFLTPSYASPESSIAAPVSLSADGRSFAYANRYCALSPSLLQCSKRQYLFYIADGLSRTTKRIAVHTSSMSPTVTIAPDGSRIAYQLSGQLYILSAR